MNKKEKAYPWQDQDVTKPWPKKFNIGHQGDLEELIAITEESQRQALQKRNQKNHSKK